MSGHASIFYRVEPADTLVSIAGRFDLSSWRALAEAPENVSRLANATRDTPLESGEMIKVPPAAGRLLKDRVFELQRLRPLLLNHFQVLDDLFHGQVAPLEVLGELGDERVVSGLLGVMDARVKGDVEALHRTAMPIAAINAALLLTHLHDHHDLKQYAGGNPQYVGLNWVMTPTLLEPWYGMWASGFWANRWQGTSAAEAKQAVTVHLNLIRSKIVQQVDQRINESYRALWALDEEDG